MLPSDRFEILVEAARPCLSRAYFPKRLATRMHLIAESLQDRRPLPVGPFDVESERGKIIAASSAPSTSAMAGSRFIYCRRE
jgi:hypothetical protein